MPANALYLAEYQAKQSNLLYQSQTSENDAEIVQPVTIDVSNFSVKAFLQFLMKLMFV